MLVAQAAHAIRLWLGEMVPLQPLIGAAERALEASR
jgi:shikimate 5-dehydrogenase